MDDTLLHGIPMVKEEKTYKRILEEFWEASGAEINHSKSMIFFFNTNPQSKEIWPIFWDLNENHSQPSTWASP
jgi:hypothetical protein